MKYLLPFLLMLAMTTPGCKKTTEPKVSGEVTINSKLYGTGPYYIIGYSFSKGALVESGSNPEPDITILAQTSPDNTSIDWVYLSTDNFQNSFSLNASFDNSVTAEDFFNNYLTVPDTIGYTGIAKDIKPYQVWTFRTREQKYVKLLILKVVAEIRDGEPYAETTFRYVYQSDGTKVFPK